LEVGGWQLVVAQRRTSQYYLGIYHRVWHSSSKDGVIPDGLVIDSVSQGFNSKCKIQNAKLGFENFLEKNFLSFILTFDF
jgi:hypothetical protein